MITPIYITLDLLLPRSNGDLSIFHIQTAFISNTKPDKLVLDEISGIFFALRYLEYTDHKAYIRNNLLTSCRMTLLNKIQYKFI